MPQFITVPEKFPTTLSGLWDEIERIAIDACDWAVIDPDSRAFLAKAENRKYRQRFYRDFSIPKKSGGVRSITAPTGYLKGAQKALSILLSTLYKAPEMVNGFTAGRSVETNAEVHVGKNYVFNTDLKDFFPSITARMVRKVLEDSGVERELARYISIVCTITTENDDLQEERGCPIATTNNHIAMRFFIISHYIADCHMPLHCDNRPFSDESGIHGAIEKKWEDQVKKSYDIDTDNNRFFYDPQGYPLHKKPTPLMLAVEEELANRPYTHGWGNNNSSTWDYMSSVSQYSYLFSYYLIPETFSNTQGINEFMEQTEWGQHFDDYNKMIFSDAIDSMARIWLHVWIKYRDWMK